MLVVKTNPVGIDVLVDTIQKKLDSKLTYTKWENNHRAYNNNNKAELYTKKGDYRECFYDDNYNIVSFFVSGSRAEVVNKEFVRQELSLIVHADLGKLFPTIQHRADEELRVSFLRVLKKFNEAVLTVNSFETGIDNVYREFDKQNIKYDDMSYLHCVRFNMTVIYKVKC